MFVRTKLNNSGSTSVQIISKAREWYKVIKSPGSATTQQETEQLSKPQGISRSETDQMIVRKFIPGVVLNPYRVAVMIL